LNPHQLKFPLAHEEYPSGFPSTNRTFPSFPPQEQFNEKEKTRRSKFISLPLVRAAIRTIRKKIALLGDLSPNIGVEGDLIFQTIQSLVFDGRVKPKNSILPKSINIFTSIGQKGC
jgi:hypothetical protein